MSHNIIITSHEVLVREISNVALAALSRCGSLLSRTTSTKHCLPFARSVAMCGSPGSDGEQITRKTLFEVYQWHDIYTCVSWKPVQFQYTWILPCEGKNAGSWFLLLHRHTVTSPEVYAFASILTFGFLQESRWFRGSLPTMLGLQKRGTQEHGAIVFIFYFLGRRDNMSAIMNLWHLRNCLKKEVWQWKSLVGVESTGTICNP